MGRSRENWLTTCLTFDFICISETRYVYKSTIEKQEVFNYCELQRFDLYESYMLSLTFFLLNHDDFINWFLQYSDSYNL